MKKIPPVDLARQYSTIREETETAVLKLLNTGYYVGGAAVTDFEQDFAQYTKVEHCIACNSGTDALYLALRALNIGAGDEVITSPFTFIATAEAVSMTGAKPIFIDIELDTFNLDPTQLEKAITPRTKAIIPVHLFGQPVNMSQVMDIAEAHQLYVIEDCAQATGAEWNGQKVGSIGHIGCFSFFPTKNLGACGDGGAVTTHDQAIALSIKMLREHGSSVRYRHDVMGINSRLDALQATILQVKLRYLEQWNQQRSEAAQRYRELLSPLPHLKLPQAIKGGQHVWNQYTIMISKRDQVREKLQEMGVISMVYYPLPLHLQPVYQDLGYLEGQLPHSEQASREVLSLPMFPDITPEEQQQVVYCLKDCLG